jgi:type IV pilus assembly protein PilC
MQFKYKAMDRGGKEIKGAIEAVSEDVVVERLRGMGYYPTEIKKTKGKATASADLLDLPVLKDISKFISRGGVSNKFMMAFTRQLATLIGAGLPLLRSLQILQDQTSNRNLREAVTAVAEDVEQGSTFSEALAKWPKIFNRLYVNMVKAGEIGGALETVLDRLAIFAEKAAAVTSKVRGAIMYPIIVVIIAGMVLCVIMIFVVPQFTSIFLELGGPGTELPGPTEFLRKVSHFLVNDWYIGIAAVIAIWIVYGRINATQRGKYMIDMIKLKLPVFGILVQKTAIARFARTFGTLLNTGVPILQALVIVRDTSGNEVVAKAVIDVHKSIRDGETISEPLKNFPSVFPPLVVHMIAVGEETGAIDEMLMKVADSYEREVDDMVDGLAKLIEPLLIVFLGVIIGFIVIALYLPIFGIYELIK